MPEELEKEEAFQLFKEMLESCFFPHSPPTPNQAICFTNCDILLCCTVGHSTDIFNLFIINFASVQLCSLQ